MATLVVLIVALASRVKRSLQPLVKVHKAIHNPVWSVQSLQMSCLWSFSIGCHWLRFIFTVQSNLRKHNSLVGAVYFVIQLGLLPAFFSSSRVSAWNIDPLRVASRSMRESKLRKSKKCFVSLSFEMCVCEWLPPVFETR